MKCERCGISGEKAELFDVIFEEKIAHMCRNCANFEDLPIIRKTPNPNELLQERHQSMYERMVKISGVQRDISSPDAGRIKPSARDTIIKKEPTMRDIVERNIKEKIQIQPVVMKKPGLVNNYHWTIMMARRARKVSQQQLADHIGVNVRVITRIEKGQLPEDDLVLRRLEDALKIKLFIAKDGKEEEKEYFTPMVTEEEMAFQEVKKQIEREKPIAFDSEVIKNLKVSDLQKIKETEKKEEPIEKERKEEAKKIEEQEPEETEQENEEIETAKVSFWKKVGKIFSSKSEEENIENEEEIRIEPQIEIPSENIKKEPERKSYRERQKDLRSSAMSKRDLSSKEINELIFGKKEEKKK